MGIKNKNKFWNNLNLNDETYIFYYNRLKELAISSFKWTGFPDDLDTRFLELLLYENGSALCLNDDQLGVITLQYTVQSPLNIYRIPILRRAFAVTGYSANRDESNSVIIWNNILRTNTEYAVRHFARKLYNADLTMDINIHAQKTPVAIVCNDNEKLSFENLYTQYAGNTPVIFGSKNLDLSAVSVLKTDAPFVADKINDYKQSVWSDALEYLGISAGITEKRERLIVSEVESSMGGVNASKISRLVARQQACEKINSMFGLNVSVDYNQDVIKWANMERTAEIEAKGYGNAYRSEVGGENGGKGEGGNNE